LRKEVIDPLLYFALVLIYLRSRQDVMRLLAALLGTGLLIAALGLAQYLFFKHALVLEEGTRRVHAVYGSANSIGLLFDYILPLGLAWLMAREGWKMRLLALVLCIPMVVVLYLTQSRGAWVAVAVATLFVAMFSLHNKQLLLAGSLIILVGLVAVLVLYHSHILNYFIEGHTNQQGVSTVTKRIYLWRSALHMLHDSPWFGYGLDNWLCHYSKNTICDNSLFHYWIVEDPPGRPTGLRDEPFLSHPHNIFLHVWVSMGIFGLLAFSAVLVLFYWLFGRILVMLRSTCVEGGEQLRWMTLGVGAALLAALVQGQVDSAFLEQDLAFCFWTLVAALLLLRTHSLTSWQDATKPTLSP
jgi:O-antigen ligase